MVQFKSWRDAYLFLLNYGNFSCLNCKYGGHNLDLDVEHSDVEYTHHFCSKTISMVRFDFQFVCGQWVSDKDGSMITDYDMDDCAFDLADEVIKEISNGEKWSFEEIKELVNEHGKVTE